MTMMGCVDGDATKEAMAAVVARTRDVAMEDRGGGGEESDSSFESSNVSPPPQEDVPEGAQGTLLEKRARASSDAPCDVGGTEGAHPAKTVKTARSCFPAERAF